MPVKTETRPTAPGTVTPKPRPITRPADDGDLAILGGRPAFGRPRHVGAPNIPDRETLMRRLDAVFEGGRLSNRGPFVRIFEEQVTKLTGVKHCIAMCNGTVALEIGARALGLADEVIVPAFTFVATAHALRWQGIQPVFCDVDPATHNLDPAKVEALITPRTTGIVAVHLWGRPAPVAELEAIAERRGLRLMFDAAHAFGCGPAGHMIGGGGDLEVFSFHATKFINTAEGGAVVTNDDDLARRVRLMQNFGFTGLDEVSALGVNGKMNDLAAAVGLSSLEHLEEWLAVNRRNRAAWADALAAVPGVELQNWGRPENRNDQYIVAEVDAVAAGISRDHLVNALRAENVLARRYFYPGCHNMEPYRSQPPAGGWNLPATEEVCRRVMVLPTGTAVSRSDIARMGRLVARVVAKGDAVTAALEENS
ncbi:MAG: aminotransferase class I/II-fold pyridoxal phosphate-dependent enzyme [bacterium]|nr:aminotransferase class I/II-fold pyridoxal phosphate-dependent enzyme [bacterium]